MRMLQYFDCARTSDIVNNLSPNWLAKTINYSKTLKHKVRIIFGISGNLNNATSKMTANFEQSKWAQSLVNKSSARQNNRYCLRAYGATTGRMNATKRTSPVKEEQLNELAGDRRLQRSLWSKTKKCRYVNFDGNLCSFMRRRAATSVLLNNSSFIKVFQRFKEQRLG